MTAKTRAALDASIAEAEKAAASSVNRLVEEFNQFAKPVAAEVEARRLGPPYVGRQAEDVINGMFNIFNTPRVMLPARAVAVPKTAPDRITVEWNDAPGLFPATAVLDRTVPGTPGIRSLKGPISAQSMRFLADLAELLRK